MAIDRILDSILDANSKIRIVRLFVNRRRDFMSSGREIARLTGLSPPAAHAALKELYNQDVLKRDILGKQHIYRLNTNNRIVRNILIPAFKTEKSVKQDIIKFIKRKILQKKLKNDIVSVVLYGSIQRGNVKKGDVDIAIVVKDSKAKARVEREFTEKIADEFREYFGVYLDVYIKTKKEFRKRVISNKPPVSTMLESYFVIYGKDPRNL